MQPSASRSGIRDRVVRCEKTIKTLAQQMAVYAAYHRNPLNRATHFVGVPLIVVAPIFLMVEVFFALGLKAGVRRHVRQRLGGDREADE